MARRLNTEEEHLFRAVLQASDSGLSETISDPFLELIRERREAALSLTPELEILLTQGQTPNGS